MTRLPHETGRDPQDGLNQPRPRGDEDLVASDPVLGAHGVTDRALQAYGRAIGTREMREAARDANRHPPELALFDTGGRPLDEVRFHPAYHAFLSAGISAGYVASAWERGGSHTVHAAFVYLASQVEPGTCCPMTMSFAAVPALDAAPAIARDWRPRVLSRAYDPSAAPRAAKAGATLGMAMTERQGGSDLRATATRAERAGDHYRLTGHKWFCSAPMSDGFLTLAAAPGGLTCFLVPRWLEGGRNGIRLLRLKDKLGNRSNASAEIAYEDAAALRLGDEGAGVRTILEMVHHTRLDTAVAPAGLMRAALREAQHWVLGRSAFQRRLIDQPLMRTVLADLVLDWEAATALGFRVARAFDDPDARPFARLAVALAKFLNNRLCPRVVAEAMEVRGGMGYVEDTGLPLLYREAPLNGIWEGAGNVICLDVLRTLDRVPEAGAALAAELESARGRDPGFDAALDAHRRRWPGRPDEAEARLFCERTALLLAAATLLGRAPAAVAEAFCRTRLRGERGQVAGALAGIDPAPILARLG